MRATTTTIMGTHQIDQLCRDEDLPVIEGQNNDKHWYQNGKHNRKDDLPAIERTNGNKVWLQNNRQHRDGDLPALVTAIGNKGWYQHGKRHRDGDRPAIEFVNGTKFWYQNDKQHRDGDRPAAVYADGRRRWFKYGIEYTRIQLTDYYSRLAHFGRYCLFRKIRINRLKHKRWIHGELLCRPPRGNFPGGQDYHKMVDYFSKL